MSKFITFTAGIFFSLNIYAESYVFGGRTHFQGVLVNQSCAFLVKTIRHASEIKAPEYSMLITFSMCPESVSSQLEIEFSEQHMPPINQLDTAVKTQQNRNFKTVFYLSNLGSTRLGPYSIEKRVLPSLYHDQSSNHLGVVLTRVREDRSSTPLLISVLYP
ncbi:hypothetical protein EC844_1157 [Acinetobacter calcoaceticus]|uniref:Uncharacterized protein n=1 Tax=Acinetobacter calcoaceticus TaxID=471 RepID=A0A4R1XS64_ACICA|nr:hypothetical protein EC844_1157 [Acinetobacter calcoaceticus]